MTLITPSGGWVADRRHDDLTVTIAARDLDPTTSCRHHATAMLRPRTQLHDAAARRPPRPAPAIRRASSIRQRLPCVARKPWMSPTIAFMLAPTHSGRPLRRHVNPDDPAASTPGLACGIGPRTDRVGTALKGAGRPTHTRCRCGSSQMPPRVSYFAWGRPWDTSPNSAICRARASPPEALTTPRLSTIDPARTITR